jgi:hypothetical protein
MKSLEQCHRREEIRLAVHSALRHHFPDLVLRAYENADQVNSLHLIHEQLGQLIDILDQSPELTLEGFRTEIRRRVCPGCAERLATGFCALRATGQCALDRCTPVLYETIRAELAADAIGAAI